MHKEELFKKFKTSLENKLHLLEDKPEETIESSLKAMWLKAYGLSISVENVKKIPLPELTEKQVDVLNSFIEQRLNNTPLAYITGKQSFMGIELLSDNRALIPRKETEILGRKALELSEKIASTKQTVYIIDVCCGSGNLGIALSFYNPHSYVNASDFSEGAVELTRENISFLNLDNKMHVKQGDLFSAFESADYYEKTDLIVCNPPYISSSKVSKMNAEISNNEPILAFDGGMLGTKIIQRLIREAPRFLIKDGWLIFEVGVGQGEFIIQLLEKTQLYSKIESVTDNSNNIRTILARKL